MSDLNDNDSVYSNIVVAVVKHVYKPSQSDLRSQDKTKIRCMLKKYKASNVQI